MSQVGTWLVGDGKPIHNTFNTLDIFGNADRCGELLLIGYLTLQPNRAGL